MWLGEEEEEATQNYKEKKDNTNGNVTDTSIHLLVIKNSINRTLKDVYVVHLTC